MAFEALYEGHCYDCQGRIEVGQLIVRHPEGALYRHVSCEDVEEASPFDLKPNEVVCTDCFIIKPCECEVS